MQSRRFHVSYTLAAQVFKGPAKPSSVSRRCAGAWPARADQKGRDRRLPGLIRRARRVSHKATWGYLSQIRFNFRSADRLEAPQTAPARMTRVSNDTCCYLAADRVSYPFSWYRQHRGLRDNAASFTFNGALDSQASRVDQSAGP